MPTVAYNRQLLDVTAAARRLAVSTWTVRRLIGRGDLPALKVGGSIRIDPDELERWLRGPAR